MDETPEPEGSRNDPPRWEDRSSQPGPSSPNSPVQRFVSSLFLSGSVKGLAGLVVVVVFLFLFGGLVWEFGLRLFFASYVERVGDALGLDSYQVQALQLLVPLLLGGTVVAYWSYNRQRSKRAKWVLAALLAGYYLLLSHTRGGDFFATDGSGAQRWYAKTPEGVRYFNHAGVDPQYGIELKPVTPEVVQELKAIADGHLAPIDPAKKPLFNPVTGAAQAWYCLDKDGKYEVFDKPGFHPTTGEELKPVSREVAAEIARQGEGEKPAPGVAPQKPLDPQATMLFDQATGKPKTWFYRGKDGRIEVYGEAGFHPVTGVALLPMTPEVASELTRQASAPADAGGAVEGLPADGSVLHPIDPATAILFDPDTGKPRTWYSEDNQGRLELFDRPGFNPQTGTVLKPITPEVAQRLHKSAPAPEADSPPAPKPAPATTSDGTSRRSTGLAAPTQPSPEVAAKDEAKERETALRRKYDPVHRDAVEALAFGQAHLDAAMSQGIAMRPEIRVALDSVKSTMRQCDSAVQEAASEYAQRCPDTLQRTIERLRALL